MPKLNKILKPTTIREYMTRMLIISLSFLMPIFCVITQGPLPSLSRYWSTELQPLFILTNLFTAYYFSQLPRWKYSGFFLVLLTAFSVEVYNITHNLLAIGFFLSVLYPFTKLHHYKWILWVYIGTLLILPFGMLFFEIVAITVICLYHGLVLYKVNRDTKKIN
jgi:hypothetical protein